MAKDNPVLPLSEKLLMIWIYQYLLGTLPSHKIDILQAELKRRYEEKKTHSAIETKIHISFEIDRSTRKYLAELLNDWEKRTGGMTKDDPVLPLSEKLLMIWIYKYLLGTLSSHKIDILQRELKRRCDEKKTRSAIETEIHKSFVDSSPRKYLAELLNDWEKRTGG